MEPAATVCLFPLQGVIFMAGPMRWRRFANRWGRLRALVKYPIVLDGRLPADLGS
jgi:hypothetical protein